VGFVDAGGGEQRALGIRKQQPAPLSRRRDDLTAVIERGEQGRTELGHPVARGHPQ
jgi:hypothetical protein